MIIDHNKTFLNGARPLIQPYAPRKKWPSLSKYNYRRTRDIPSPAEPLSQYIHWIVLHHTGIHHNILWDPQYSTSAHYMIFEDGQILQLVDDQYRAYHASLQADQQFWNYLDSRGHPDINSYSLGIELVHQGHHTDAPFSEPQILSLVYLCTYLMSLYDIPPYHVISHRQLSPYTRLDPKEDFPWKTLARYGIGYFPESDSPRSSISSSSQILDELGYHTIDDTFYQLAAFQAQYVPEIYKNDSFLSGIQRIRSKHGQEFLDAYWECAHETHTIGHLNDLTLERLQQVHYAFQDDKLFSPIIEPPSNLMKAPYDR